MAKLFIANTSKQNHTFAYRQKIRDVGATNADGDRLPTHGEMRFIDIRMGKQIQIPGDWKPADLDDLLLKQHPHIPEFKDLKRVKGYQGLCYSIDESVPLGKIYEQQVAQNDEARTTLSKEKIQESAAGIAANVREVANQSGTEFRDLKQTDVQVSQDPAKDVNGGDSKVNLVAQVPEEGKTPTPPGRAARGGKDG